MGTPFATGDTSFSRPSRNIAIYGHNFMDFVKSASLHENDVTVTGDDRLLTLITCDRTCGGADGRFVVMAVKED